MIINHNMNAMNAHRNMMSNTNRAGKSMEKLSSGLRINRAGDDAAGLAISEKMRSQIRGLDQAARNGQDGISMIQTAEGALNETQSILQRMRELSDQSANGTNTDADRASIQDEINQLTSEINRIGNTTEFNTQKVLNGGMDSNDGKKITQATSAKISKIDFEGLDTKAKADAITDASLNSATITVDDTTFDIKSVLTSAASGVTAQNIVDGLKDITSGGVKLSDVLDIKVEGSKIVYESKSEGSASEIKIAIDADDTATGASVGKMLSVTSVTTANISAVGDPTTIERAGLQADNELSTSGDITITKGDSFKIAIGSESDITINFNETKTYDTQNDDANVSKAAMEDLVKDLNGALQDAGLSGRVTASLSKDNEIQFISESGKDLKLTDGTNKPLASALGFAGGDMDAPKNVEQVVGPGAQGSGFHTTFQIGANKGQTMSLQINDMRSAALGITGNAGQAGFTTENTVTNGTTDIKAEAALNVMSKESASDAIETLDKAIASVSAERGKLGAVQNRLEHTINNLSTSSENLSSAESRVRDVDMANEMLNFSKENILQQAAQAMLAQAKQAPQGVLQLLR